MPSGQRAADALPPEAADLQDGPLVVEPVRVRQGLVPEQAAADLVVPGLALEAARAGAEAVGA